MGESRENHHENKPKEEWSHSLVERQVRRADQALLPLSPTASLRVVGRECHTPLLANSFLEWKPLETG